MTEATTPKPSKKALERERQAQLEVAREAGRRLRWEAHPAPTPESNPDVWPQDRPDLFKAALAGWRAMDNRISANDLGQEGRALFHAGQPIPEWPFGASSFEEAVNHVRRISSLRGGWQRAEAEKATADRHQRLLAERADADHRGNVLPTEERAQRGPLRQERVQMHDARGKMTGVSRAYRDRHPTLLHRIAAKHRADFTGGIVRAGLRLRELWERAGMEHRMVASLTPFAGTGGKGEMSDERTAAFESYSRTLARAWPLRLTREVVVKMVIDEVPLAQIDLLKVGLTQLAKYWDELDKEEPDDGEG